MIKSFVLFQLAIGGGVLTQQTETQWINAFYPMYQGHVWKYCSSSSVKLDAECVTWRVETVSKSDKGLTATLSSYPATDDDSLMTLSSTSSYVQESSLKHKILILGHKTGYRWSYREWDERKKSSFYDTFEIKGFGRCGINLYMSRQCIVVSETDSSIKIVQSVTYAENIGPVEYRYFHIGDKTAFRVLKLLSN